MAWEKQEEVLLLLLNVRIKELFSLEKTSKNIYMLLEDIQGW